MTEGIGEVDPLASVNMFSRAGSIQHNRLYSDRHLPGKRRLSETSRANEINFEQTKELVPTTYPSFQTVPRQSRNSYLLRVTHQPNVKTIYKPNFDFGKSKGPEFSFYRQKLIRKIDNISIDPDILCPQEVQPRKKCEHKMNRGHEVQKPLIAKDCLNWRKNHHELDFQKQVSHRQNKSFMSTGFNTTSNSPTNQTKIDSGNNKLNKAHKFQSDSPHKYLKQCSKGKKSDIFDASNVNWGIVKKNWNTRGITPFTTYTQKIKVRQDRSEPAWNPRLDYSPDISKIKPKVSSFADFQHSTNRLQNSEHHKYPMRLAQRKDYGLTKYAQLKQIVAALNH